MFTYLLTKAYTRTGVEGKEDEWIRGQVLVQPLVNEAIWVKFVSFIGGAKKNGISSEAHDSLRYTYRQGPTSPYVGA